MAEDLPIINRPLQVPFPPKATIQCIYSSQHPETDESVEPALIFTHGAGGTLKTDAIVDFSEGFALNSRSGIVCLQGNMNLKSRVKFFNTVMDNLGYSKCLGGRSMGARAAVMAATDETTHLVLVSYPLHTDKAIRDQILLDLPASLKVIFVSGNKDTMCNFDKLEDVRGRMKCQTWRVVVQGADHGMILSPKAGTHDTGRKIGEVVAYWLDNADGNSTESRIEWNSVAEIAQWSGWLSENSRSADQGHDGAKSTKHEEDPLTHRRKPNTRGGESCEEMNPRKPKKRRTAR